MNDTEKARTLDDLLKLIRHTNDVPEDQIRAIRAFCAYHGLLDDGHYSQMSKEELSHWLIGEFDWAGEKPTTVANDKDKEGDSNHED